MGINQWRDENEWPLKRTRFTAAYIHSSGRANGSSDDGTLSFDPPTSVELPDHFTYDPSDPAPTSGGAMIGPDAGYRVQNQVEQRSDVLIFSTAPLQHDVEVTGPVNAVLYVTTDATSTDFTVKLVDVHPDGASYNVCDGILRREYSDPGRIERIEIELWPTSMVFKRNHRIRLEVSSSNFPRFDRNPNTGRSIAHETQQRMAHQTPYHSAATPSQIILPIIPR